VDDQEFVFGVRSVRVGVSFAGNTVSGPVFTFVRFALTITTGDDEIGGK
jgi:hypothetical protein